MKYKIRSIANISPIFLFIFICSCTTSGQKKENREDLVVDAGSYTVIMPKGDDWKIAVNKERGLVAFKRPVTWWTGKVLGNVMIKVFQNDVAEVKRGLTEEQVADDYRNLEEQIMIEEGVKKGKYELLNLHKKTITIEGKKFYTMTYKTSKKISMGWVGGTISNAILYLYFPTDFGTEHRFFGFLINEAHKSGSLAKGSLEDIRPVINSFRLK